MAPPYKGARGIRLNTRNDEKARAAIKTTHIIKRLNAFVLCENDPQTNKPVEMTKTQVSAALGLLRKTLPDLVTAELNVNDNRDLHEFSTAELQNIVAGLANSGSARAAETEGSEVPADSVH